MRLPLILLLLTGSLAGQSQTPAAQKDGPVVEFRSYTLKPGTRDAFHQLVLEYSLPMLQRWKITVLGYGPSLQEDSSYYLIRAYPGLEARQQSEDAFYGSDEWKKGPREAIVSKIVGYTTVILPADSILHLAEKITRMTNITTHATDSAQLSELNRHFIENFVNQDTVRHNTIIHPDFVCIQGDGTIETREEYMKRWASGYSKSGYTSFSYTDELIRIFGNTALVRSKTVYTRTADGRSVHGNSIYTDTY